MNLVIIGGVGATKVGELVSKSYDDIEVQVFKDTDIFLKEVLLRNMEIHRVLLMQDGVEFLEDERVYNFVDYMFEHYPAARIITVSKDEDINKFLGELINSPYSLHFKIKGTIKSKVLLDIISKDVSVLKNIYSDSIYQRESQGVTDIVDEVKTEENNQTIEKKGKRGFLSKIFGVGYKGNPKELSNKQKGKIGQGTGVDEFSNPEEEETDISFGMFDEEENDIGMGLENRDVFEELETEDDTFIEGKQDLDEWVAAEEEEIDEEEIEDNEIEEIDIEEMEIDDDGLFAEIEDDWSTGNEEDIDFNSGFDSLDTEEENTEESIEKKEKVQRVNKFDEIKQEIENKEIYTNNDNAIKEVRKQLDFEEVESEGIEGIDLEHLMEDYENSRTRVVERVVERVVTTGGHRQFRNKNGVRIIIVTGDRRVGATRLSMNLANLFAKQDKTLLVDLDRYRKGTITYIGVDELIEEEEHIQNGLTHLKSIKMLPNVSYLYPKGGFYCLFSMYGEEVTDKQVDTVQKILYNQKEYQTIVIDCPIENLYLLSDLLYTSTVLVSIEDDKVGITNTVLALNASVEEKYMTALYNNSMAVVARGSNIERYKEEMEDVVNIFGLDETTYNWGDLEIIGTIKGTKGIVKRIGG